MAYKNYINYTNTRPPLFFDNFNNNTQKNRQKYLVNPKSL